MSIYTASNRISAVYVGNEGSNSGSTLYSLVRVKGSDIGRSSTASAPAHVAGDMLLMVLGHSETTPPPTPSGWTLYKSISTAGGPQFTSAIYYRFAANSNAISVNLAVQMDWMILAISGVDSGSPFGAYADGNSYQAFTHTAPGITMTGAATSSNLVLSIFSGKSTVNQWNVPPAGYTTAVGSNIWNSVAIARNDRTTAAVAPINITASTGLASSFWCFTHTVEIKAFPTILPPSQGSSVYLGDTLVWPDGLHSEIIFDPIYPKPPEAVLHEFYPPPGTQSVDMVAIGGGAGGKSAEVTDGAGGGGGVWAGMTFRYGVHWSETSALNIFVGYGGRNGIYLQQSASGGDRSGCWYFEGGTLKQFAGSGGVVGSGSNRTGGTPASFTFNGRTYKGGAGGNGTAKDGAAGGFPGGGGQGGQAAPLGGGKGGVGGDGRVVVYCY